MAWQTLLSNLEVKMQSRLEPTAALTTVSVSRKRWLSILATLSSSQLHILWHFDPFCSLKLTSVCQNIEGENPQTEQMNKHFSCEQSY